MYYELKYKLKNSNEEISIIYENRDEVSSIINQINRGITSIKKVLINGIKSLEYINIIEQNYAYIENGDFYDYKKYINNGEIFEVPKLSIYLDENFIEKRKDITNDLFYENNIGHLDENIINYKNSILTVYGKIFNIKNDSKYGEIIDLIFRTSKKLNKEEITYNQIYDFFNENKEKYKNINNSDFKYSTIRDTLKNKLKEITNKNKLKNDIFKLAIDSIKINYNG